MKECPYCAEEIQDEAIKCKYCKSLLSSPPPLEPEIQKVNYPPSKEGPQLNTKKCPFCAKEIQKEAIKCKYCKKSLTKDTAPELHKSEKTTTYTPKITTPQNKIGWKAICFILGSVLVVLVILGFILFNIQNKPINDVPVYPVQGNPVQENTETSASNFTISNVGIPLLSEMGGELIPVVCGCGSAIGLGDPSVQFQITNHNHVAASVTLRTEIPDWSERSERTVEISPGETQTIPLKLTFKSRFYNNPEQVDTQLNYKVTYNGTIVSNGSESKPVKIAASETMLWGPKTTRLIAAFVCPKGATVNKIAQKAKEHMGYDRQLSGYQGNTEQQAKAIFFALGADFNLSYVNYPVSFAPGFTQIVRAPRESFKYSSANCIDGAVLYASVFENLGMEPLIILRPGHAFVAVRNSVGGPIICIETTRTSDAKHAILSWLNYGGLGAFENAENLARNEYIQLAKSPQTSGIQVIDIKQERQAGIYPLFTDEQ